MSEKKSILLIEDDELDVISVERSLKIIGIPYELYTACNGIEALQMLIGTKESEIIPMPDIILLDLHMPKMNGIEFLNKLRTYNRFDTTKIFVITASNEERGRLAIEQLNVTGYFIKPLNFNENTKRGSSMENFMHFQLVKILGFV